MTIPNGAVQPRVLVVDDEAGIRLFIRRVLEKAGCSVTEASDGQEALDRFAQSPGAFQIVLCDLQMPQVGGESLAAQLLTADSQIQVVCMSGYVLEHRRPLDPRLSYLQKPFSGDDLRCVVRRLTDQA